MRLLLTSLVVLAAAAPAGATVPPPQLKIEGMQPLIVAGSGFHPSESITLRISGANPPRLLHSDRNGAFQVRLTSIRTFRCAAFIVVATGASGRTASAHLPRPACLTQRSGNGSTQ